MLDIFFLKLNSATREKEEEDEEEIAVWKTDFDQIFKSQQKRRRILGRKVINISKEMNDIDKRIKMEVEVFNNKSDKIVLEKDESECNIFFLICSYFMNQNKNQKNNNYHLNLWN